MKTIALISTISILLILNLEIVGQNSTNTSIESKYQNQVDYLIKNEDFDKKLWEKTTKLFESLQIIDCHSHQPFRPNVIPKQISYEYLNTHSNIGLVHGFPLRRGSTETIFDRIINDISNFKKEIAVSNLNVLVVKNSTDFELAKSNHQIPIMIHLESFEGLAGGKISLLEKYYQNGVRMIGFNQSGLDTVWLNDKLTRYGKDLIDGLNRLGIICDITHIRRTIQKQVIERSTIPVIISHGGAFNAVNSDFNSHDSLLKKMTLKGGLIGVTFFSGQLSPKVLSEINSGEAWDKTSRATIAELIDHIDYLKQLVGIDYIGIGSDFGGSGKMSPAGLETIEGFPLIIYHMLKRGYSEEEIRKVMGLNFISYFKRVEKMATIN